MKVLKWAAAVLLLVAGPVTGQEIDQDLGQDMGQNGALQTLTGPAEGQAIGIDQTTFTPTQFQDLQFDVEAERPSPIPTAHFAARSAFRNFSMSPDGVHIAIRRVVDGDTALILVDAATHQTLKIYNLSEDQRLDWFRWAGNEKLITSISVEGD